MNHPRWLALSRTPPTMTTTKTPPRADVLRQQLAAQGMTPGEVERRIQNTGPERHEERIQATLAAACTYALSLPNVFDPLSVNALNRRRLIEWVVLCLDLGRKGGTGGLGRDGDTDRLPPFAGLGSGRWKARDGVIYRGAATEARKRVENALAARGWTPGFRRGPDGSLWAFLDDGRGTTCPGVAWSGIEAPREWLPWLEALSLRLAAGQRW